MEMRTFKKYTLGLILILQQFVFAQTKEMVILKKNGTKSYVAIEEIDKLTFIDPGNKGTVTDIDDNIYQTVKIGNQWWMAENLKVSRYRSGVEIPYVHDDNEWSDRETPAYCYYENNSEYADDYGALYNWYAVIRSDLPPEGWRIPSFKDWMVLVEFLGDEGGEKLKSTWNWESDGNGSDDYNFSALPAGFRDEFGNFTSMGYYADFWSASEKIINSAWDGSLVSDDAGIMQCDYDVRGGFSVRCIRE